MLAGVVNAVAIALVVTALVGPDINPALATLTWLGRGRLRAGRVVFHLVARYLVRGMEDRP